MSQLLDLLCTEYENEYGVAYNNGIELLNKCTEKHKLDMRYFTNLWGREQYTLRSEDVDIINGVIINYTNNEEKEISIPEEINNQKITHIANDAFNSKGLKSVTIPHSVIYIYIYIYIYWKRCICK